MTYSEKQFSIPELQGISAKTIEEHLKLYAGYVKHLNLIQDKVAELSADYEKNAFTIGELRRRLGFEFDGMRNHEYYFEQFEGGAAAAEKDSDFAKKIDADLGGFDAWLTGFKALAMTRGVGWAVLYFDKKTGQLVQTWIEEQHLGQLAGLDVILALDMWEHSYMLDYVPSEKKKYVEAFFSNLNWKVVEERYVKSVSQL
ncbi:MAG TPA: Fe-Mn family superoxide dismutase [Candidatus Paceibacterota bacterium]